MLDASTADDADAANDAEATLPLSLPFQIARNEDMAITSSGFNWENGFVVTIDGQPAPNVSGFNNTIVVFVPGSGPEPVNANETAHLTI